MAFYAVRQGHQIGIFDNWDSCSKATNGFSGPEYKRFDTQQEAEAYMRGKDLYDEIVEADLRNGCAVAFCDGSFDKSKKRYSYGVLIVDLDGTESEICGSSANPEYLDTQNIIGEVLGAINAMDWAVSNGRTKIKIYHDYAGIGKWITGDWTASSKVARMYKGIYSQKYADVLDVSFKKVKGHSNNRYNDKADELAGRALSDGSRVPIAGDNWFSLDHFEKRELDVIIELISEDHPEIEHVKTDQTNGTLYKFFLAKNKLSVTLFNNKKLLIQGADTILFQIFTTYVNELIGVKEKEVFGNAYRKSINVELVDENVRDICPTFPSNYPIGIKRLIRQSIINLLYFNECEDYSQYVFPALRALEGHMKYLFGIEGIQITSKTMFGFFNKDDSRNEYYLPETTIGDAKLRSKLESCYNHYNTTRHTLFHFGDIIGNTETTRVLETKSEADIEIKKCLTLICE